MYDSYRKGYEEICFIGDSCWGEGKVESRVCHFKSVVFSIQCLLCADTGDSLDGVLVGDWVDMQQTGMLEKGRGGFVRICIIFLSQGNDILKSLFLPLPLALDLDLHIYSIPQRHLLPIEILFPKSHQDSETTPTDIRFKNKNMVDNGIKSYSIHSRQRSWW
jgi:hypothetical protein